MCTSVRRQLVLLLLLLVASCCTSDWDGCPYSSDQFSPINEDLCLGVSTPGCIDSAVRWCQENGDRYNITFLQMRDVNLKLFINISDTLVAGGVEEVWVEARQPYENAAAFVHSNHGNGSYIYQIGESPVRPWILSELCLTYHLNTGSLMVRGCTGHFVVACLSPRDRIRAVVSPACPEEHLAIPSLQGSCFGKLSWHFGNATSCPVFDNHTRLGIIGRLHSVNTYTNVSKQDPENQDVGWMYPYSIWSNGSAVTVLVENNYDVNVNATSALSAYCQIDPKMSPYDELGINLSIERYYNGSIQLLLVVEPWQRLVQTPHCFTDAVGYLPTRSQMRELALGRYNVKFSGDGYYWCEAHDALTASLAISPRTLVLQSPDQQVLSLLLILRENSTEREGLSQNATQLQNEIILNTDSSWDFLEIIQGIHEPLAMQLKVTPTQLKLKQLLTMGIVFHVNGPVTDTALATMQTEGSNHPELEFSIRYIRNTQICPQIDQWPETIIGQVAVAANDSRNRRKCAGDFNVGGHWEDIEYIDIETLDLNDAIDGLHNISLHPVHYTEFENAIGKIDKILSFSRLDLSKHASTIVDTVDRILTQVELDPVFNAIHIVKPQLAVLVVDFINQTDPVLGFVLTGEDESGDLSSSLLTQLTIGQEVPDNSSVEVGVALPEFVVQQEGTRMAFTVFAEDDIFAHNASAIPVTVNSRVLSIALITQAGSVHTLGDGQYVDIVFKPSSDVTENKTKRCAFWDLDASQWSTDGCWLVGTSSSGLDTCRCTHLTHYAQILTDDDIDLDSFHMAVMDVVSVVGCCMSLMGILAIVVTAVLVKRWREKLEHKVLLNLSLAMALTMVSFLVTNVHVQGPLCPVLGVVLHYSVLASMCWMLASAVTHYVRLTTFCGPLAIPNFLLKASAFSWGAPLLPIGLLLAADHANYNLSTRGFCYPSGVAFYAAVLAPTALILIVNMVTYSLILYHLNLWPCCKKAENFRRIGLSERKMLIRKVTTSFLLFFLFGLTWVFGLFATSIVAAYLFCISVTMQGFVLFLFFVVFEQNARKYVIEMMPKNIIAPFNKLRRSNDNSCTSSSTVQDIHENKIVTSEVKSRIR